MKLAHGVVRLDEGEEEVREVAGDDGTAARLLEFEALVVNGAMSRAREGDG
jgi:hypothetical protein